MRIFWDLNKSKELVRKTLSVLEIHLSKDIDGDGMLG